MKKTGMMLMALLLVAGSAVATEDVLVYPVRGLAQPYELAACPFGANHRGDCVYGNHGTEVYTVDNWVDGDESYAYHFSPLDEDCGCSQGFYLQRVWITMYFDERDVPATFDAYISLDEALWDGQCYYPGDAECTSEISTIQIDEPGYYEIGIPMCDACACAYLNYHYFISFHIVSSFGGGNTPGLVTDDRLDECTAYHTDGLGWEDLIVTHDFPGNILMRADVLCCEYPVGSESRTWGSMKALYR